MMSHITTSFTTYVAISRFRHALLTDSGPQFFPKMPFCKLIFAMSLPASANRLLPDHGAEATKYLRAFIGDHYVRDDAPVFKALWQTYNDCQFVDNEGGAHPYQCHAIPPLNGI